jgi:hypothetical protein
MKKFFKNILKFLLFGFVFYIVSVVLWSQFVPFGFLKKNMLYPIGGKGFTHSRLIDADTTKNIDLLFLGSSHAFRGLDPRIYLENNIRAFNLGSPSQTPIQTKFLLENYLDQFNPSLVIFEVYPATFQNDGVESSLDLIANSENLAGTLRMSTQVNHLKTYNSLIYDLFRESLNLNTNYLEPKIKESDTYVAGGFVESSICQNQAPITDKIKENWKASEWEISSSQWNAFQDILLLLYERGIPYMLIQVPVTKLAHELYENNSFIDSLFMSEGSYYNFNEILLLNDTTDFIDYHHLNQNGVKKVNAELLNIIIESHKTFDNEIQ